ncbi:MAG: glycerol dehydrogenase [Propionibacteriaceae bacterium]|jgi:glycerol dehydrogenase|nr:glycerol dehydrogenase [Propionibacteriaceae bacterium]
MKKAILLPRKFIQGRGVISEVGEYAAMLGKKAVILWGKRAKAASGEAVLKSLADAGVAAAELEFCGETTKAEAERVAQAAQDADLVIGIGGGKCIDAAKGGAIYAKLPHIIVPTVASNDAPTSACTVWYDDDGVCTGFDMWPANPDYILVDTDIIVAAPVRLFVAGIGDAIATWYEADLNDQSRAVTCSGGTATLTALAMAKLCRDTIFEYGLKAIADVSAHVVTPAVDKVVEATTLLSGVGWESGGLATAHALANAFPALPETHGFYHGEKVAFGLVAQLCLDDAIDPELAEATVAFLVQAGLPVCFADLNIAGVSEERLRAFAADTAGEGSFVHNHPRVVTGGDLYDALVSADVFGRRVKAESGA